MKLKILALCIAVLATVGLSGCGKELNASMEGDIEDVKSSDFIVICKSPMSLVYDPVTRIIYIYNYTQNGEVYTAYYAPNGLPYKYNAETNTFEEIKE